MHTQIPVTRAGRSVRVASVAGLALLAGLLSGAGSAADENAEPAGLAATCGTEDGGEAAAAASVALSVDVPATGEVDRPVQPGPVTLTLTLARSDLAGLLPEGTEAVVSRAALAVKVAQNGASAEAPWQLTAPSTPLGADGDLVLVHTGEVPHVTFGAAGDVDFSLGEFTVELLSAAATTATEAPPALATLTCRLDDGQDGHLATTRVTDGSGTRPSAPATPTDPAGGAGRAERQDIAVERPAAAGDEDPDFCPVERPVGELDASEAPQPPPGDPVRITVIPTGGTFSCANALGLANVRKLNGAMIINNPDAPALISVLATQRVATRATNAQGGPYTRIDSLANLDLPDAESTFLTFGFQPVTAKVSFENGPITISTGSYGVPPNRVSFATAYFKQSLRLHDVEVNGTPLDVGNDCRTSKPFKVVLNGGDDYTNVALGGVLEGEVDIPAFTGCGTGGEDLDPLFTASISGPGNRVFMNQAPTCIPANPTRSYCPPPLPTLPGSES
ncbi:MULTISPECIES: DUF6801 domain-containing protein [unclassified Streptomyces]|uniref:DUF6801 domain-containing protein n=1 Tax=unclassified Streptomyces TaxID=2593676 RepID=UPI000DAE046B|nr:MULTISPECIES: DUF6801 domain-containing protein [unclassified Streptomyces]PZT77764.1 hypothetical protein DNK56_32020 [Streptomyces sp. AC1-42W]PZT78284.1 hypothetical protein DNK55_00670 [Streptomyces sp. AC1-42T]